MHTQNSIKPQRLEARPEAISQLIESVVPCCSAAWRCPHIVGGAAEAKMVEMRRSDVAMVGSVAQQ